MTALEKHILSLQEKVDQLNSEIRTLLAFTSLEQKPTSKAESPSISRYMQDKQVTAGKETAIGLNRYRQLHTNE